MSKSDLIEMEGTIVEKLPDRASDSVRRICKKI